MPYQPPFPSQVPGQLIQPLDELQRLYQMLMLPQGQDLGPTPPQKDQSRIPPEDTPLFPGPTYTGAGFDQGYQPSATPGNIHRPLDWMLPQITGGPETTRDPSAPDYIPGPTVQANYGQPIAPSQAPTVPSQEAPVAPAGPDPRLMAFLQALQGVQAPPEPEPVRIGTPPPPAQPHPATGALLQLLLAGGGAGGQPSALASLLGR